MSSEQLEASLLHDQDSIAAIEAEWRALAEARGNAFLSPDWFASWHENRPEATSALVIATRDRDGRLAGVLPLTLDFSRRPRVISFPAAQFGDRFGPTASSSEESRVAAAAMGALERAGLDRYTLVLNNVERDSTWSAAIQSASKSPRAGIVQQQAEQPYIDLAGLDWDGYLQTRSSKFRKRLRQRERTLQKAHEVSDRLATAETLEADLSLYFDLHGRRWDEESTILSPWARGFLGSFAERAQRQGWLRLRFLEVDGTAVAANLGWRLGSRHAYYNAGFDPAWAEYSVGFILLARVIQGAVEEGAKEFDMLLGDDGYKQRFMNAAREVETVVLPRAMTPAWLLLSAEARARKLGRGFARRPGGAATARTLKRLLPTSRGA